MRFFQRNTALTQLQAVDVPLRIIVSEPDITSRSMICALFQSDAKTIVTCVEDSQLLSAIHETAPHIVIVDLHSPSIRRGLDWKALGIQPAPATIVTVFDRSALSAFASNAVDFLVKPFNLERLESALDLATAAIGEAQSAVVPASSLIRAEHGEQRQFAQRLAVEADEKIVILRTGDIEWLEASGKYSRVHLGKTVHLLRQSLESLEGLLNRRRFLRFHRNVIVNLDHVEGFHLPVQGNMFVRLKSGLCLSLPEGESRLVA